MRLIRYSCLCVIFLILWAVSEFIENDTLIVETEIGTFSCLIMAKLEDIHRDIIREREDGEEQ